MSQAKRLPIPGQMVEMRLCSGCITRVVTSVNSRDQTVRVARVGVYVGAMIDGQIPASIAYPIEDIVALGDMVEI